jgi:hypothetical protein
MPERNGVLKHSNKHGGRSNLKSLVRGLVWAGWVLLMLVGAAGRSS